MCYGQNRAIGEFLEEKVSQFLSGGKMVRSTQSISLKQLVFDYGFDIVCVNKSKEEVKQILVLKSRCFQMLSDEKLLTLEEYQHKYSYLTLCKEV